jgi:transcription-repair coupling factor (superfamily II helicase)
MIIHRSDMFGLAQLYQLRGRVGRSKLRGYAYLTVPPERGLSEAAEKRLEVMQTLDTLGAGFMLARHDLDIRGAGNLLGEEQSGHIREVGIELYQQLLEEAVAAARAGGKTQSDAGAWSPTLNLGMEVLIPDAYVADLGVRLALYRRAAALKDRAELDALAAELIDRFGPLPAEVDNLLKTVALKLLCKVANIEKVDVGPKGAVIALRKNEFPNPMGLVNYVARPDSDLRLRPDQRLVLSRDWRDRSDQLEILTALIGEIAAIAVAPQPAALPGSARPATQPGKTARR